ncbi:MAG: dihydroorotate dehydrogenase electron transfer subunit [Pirellulales bacterium]
MSHEAHPTWFADQAWHGRTEVRENVRLARDTYRLRFDCPAIARRIVPGQFIMLRLAGFDDPLLGRPLALYDTVDGPDGTALALDVVYVVAGKLTRKLACMGPGQAVEVWGPLGNGFPIRPAGHLLMVAGGIGQTPFLALAQEYLGRRAYGDPPRAQSRSAAVTLCYGARSGDLLAGVADFERLGVRVLTSTDDGSAGRPGLVTELLEEELSRGERVQPGTRPHVVCCGPEPMMAAVAAIARRARLPCQVSLETPMACGIGICFSCVAKVRDAQGGWDYRRTCVEGPIFDAASIEFGS